MDDRKVVEVQIDRPVRAAVTVEARCHLGMPVVIDVPPILDDGTPFPTTHWLTCPLAVRRVSRLESEGGVKAADELIASDPSVAEAWREAMDRYASERDQRVPDGWQGPTPSGGVAGSRGGVKCLHAQYADHAAGGANPIGRGVADAIEPLDCSDVCVLESEGVLAFNPEWTEPRPG